MKRMFRPVVIVNIFGALGYMSLLAAWAFLAAITIALLLDSSIIGTDSTNIVQNSNTSSVGESSPVLAVISYIITIVVVLVSMAIIIILPYLIGKWSSRLLRRLMTLLKLDIASRRQLFLAKCILATLPLVGFMFIHLIFAPENMTFAAMHIATVVFSTLSIGLFAAQLLIARRLDVSVDKSW